MKNRSIILATLVGMSMAVFAVPALAQGAADAVNGADAAAVTANADILSFLQGFLPESVGTWLTFAVTACAALAVALPAPKEGGNVVYRGLYAVVQWIGLNIGHAKNAGAGKTNG